MIRYVSTLGVLANLTTKITRSYQNDNINSCMLNGTKTYVVLGLFGSVTTSPLQRLPRPAFP